MYILDPLLTAAVVLPFSLLAGYYFLLIFWKTLQDTPELTGWKTHAYFAGLLIAELMSIALFGFAIYIVISAGLGLH